MHRSQQMLPLEALGANSLCRALAKRTIRTSEKSPANFEAYSTSLPGVPRERVYG